MVLTLLNPIILFGVVQVMLETYKQHLRILMLKQYSTGNAFKINGKTLVMRIMNPLTAGGRALPQDWGEKGGTYL